MIEDYYPGCSVELRNGDIIHNVWHTPKAPPEHQLTAFKAGVCSGDLSQLTACLLADHRQSIGMQSACWYDCGRYTGTREHVLDIIKVLPKKDDMIPPRGTPEFNTYAAGVMTSKGEIECKLRSDSSWRPTTTPNWDWSSTDYRVKPADTYRWWSVEEAMLFAVKYPTLFIKHVPGQVKTAYLVIQDGNVYISTASHSKFARPSPDVVMSLDGKTWAPIGVKV